MGLLDASPEEPRSKTRHLTIAAVALVLLIAGGLWYTFRFYPEKRAISRFFDALTAGDTARAYQLWKAGPSYTEKDFLDDWSPSGYYGPVKSYRIESVSSPKGGGSGVIVVVEISPFAPFPSREDVVKSRRIREVRLWVETKDKSLSFAP